MMLQGHEGDVQLDTIGDIHNDLQIGMSIKV